MKTSFFKIVMTVVVVLLAVGGSFATHIYALQKPTRIPIVGYATSINGTPCKITVDCDSSNPVICTVIVGASPRIASGKFNPEDTACPIWLGRKNP